MAVVEVFRGASVGDPRLPSHHRTLPTTTGPSSFSGVLAWDGARAIGAGGVDLVQEASTLD